MKVIFVCTENSCRSQIAEAFAKTYKIQAFSAGSNPGKSVNPKAIELMKEIGYDLSGNKPKAVIDFQDEIFDIAVTMGCGDACPLLSARRRVAWQIPDPRDMSLEEFRVVRDMIEVKVKTLMAKLEMCWFCDDKMVCWCEDSKNCQCR